MTTVFDILCYGIALVAAVWATGAILCFLGLLCWGMAVGLFRQTNDYVGWFWAAAVTAFQWPNTIRDILRAQRSR